MQGGILEYGFFGIVWVAWLASVAVPIAGVVLAVIAYRQWRRHCAVVEDSLDMIARQLAMRADASGVAGTPENPRGGP